MARMISLRASSGSDLTEVAQALIDEGMDWLSPDATLEEILEAISMMNGFGVAIDCNETLNRVMSLSTSMRLTKDGTGTVGTEFFENDDEVGTEAVIRNMDVDTGISLTIPSADIIYVGTEIDITTLDIDNPITTMTKGDTHQLIWSGTTPTGIDIISSDLVFTSSHQNVSVSPTGNVAADDIGTATVEVSSRKDPAIKVELNITVS